MPCLQLRNSAVSMQHQTKDMRTGWRKIQESDLQLYHVTIPIMTIIYYYDCQLRPSAAYIYSIGPLQALVS